MSSSPPDNTDFLKSVLDNVKDLPPAFRFILVALILLAFLALLGIVVIPDYFVPLVIGAVIFFGLAWMVYQYAMKKLELTHSDSGAPSPGSSDEEGETPPEPPGEEPEPVAPEKQRAAYLKWVQRQTGLLSLGGIDPEAAAGDTDASLDLSAVYTALLTTTLEEQEKPEQRWHISREARYVSALAQLNRHDRLVLLGDPGSGKSTFVNFVTLCLAGSALGSPYANVERLTAPLPDEKGEPQEEQQPWDHGGLLPVRVILRDFAARGLPPAGQPVNADTLWQFIEAELGRDGLETCLPWLRAELEQGGLLLLDGLDEVPEADERRAQIKKVVDDFAQDYPRCRILVTSRIYAYQQQDWRLRRFTETVLAPFSDGQIRRFVDGWYAHTAVLRGKDPQDMQGRAELLKRAIFGSRQLLELARRPLLLTLMASLHAWRGGTLPDKREELSADAVDLLLNRWESQRIVRVGEEIKVIQPSLAEWLEVDWEQIRGLLNQLAYEAHAAQPDLAGTADIPEDDLVAGLVRLSGKRGVQPRLLVEFLSDRAGLLLPRGVGVYSFPHRTFQEYLAACYLTDDSDYPDTLAELARKDPNRWREVLLLAGAKSKRGQYNNIWELADALSPAEDDLAANDALWGAHLAGQMLAETVEPHRPLGTRQAARWNRVQERLLVCLGAPELPPAERALAGQALGRLGDPREEIMTVARMPFCYVPGGPFWMGHEEGDDDEKPLHLNESLSYDYWLAQYPVTNSQFAEFVEAGGYGKADYWPEAAQAGYWREGAFKGLWESDFRDRPYDFGRPFNLPNHPAVGVSWYEALAFCRWLTELWRDRLPAGYGITLPSEAEWEKGARGGLQIPAAPVCSAGFSPLTAEAVSTNGDAKRRFPWLGEGLFANVQESGVGATSAPGCFPRGQSPVGCQDMSGNVWEWTRSHYEEYEYVPGDGREDLTAGSYTARVLRGGAYYSEANDARCPRRSRRDPLSRSNVIGCRVAAAPCLPLPSGPSAL